MLFVFNAVSQGLNGEIGFNDNYNQHAGKIVVDDEYTYLLKQANDTEDLTHNTEIVKLDTLENILWTKKIEPSDVKHIEHVDIALSSNGGTIIVGHGRGTCDIIDDCKGFVIEYNSNGDIIWTKLFSIENCEETTLSGLSLIDGQPNINYSDGEVSKIYTFNSSGEIVDSLLVTPHQLGGVQNLSSFEKIAFRKDTLYGIDDTGQTISEIGFNSDIKDIAVFNDTLFVLTQDSIFKYDNALQKLENTTINGYSEYSNLKVGNNSIAFISHDENDQHIIKLDHDFNVLETISIPVALSLNTTKDFNDLHFTCAINFDLTHFQTIRQLDFSLQSNESVALKSTDIGIIGIEVTKVDIKAEEVEGVYNFKISANVLLKNFGDNILEDCRINNFMHDNHACGHNVYFEHFSDLNLAPGESTWVSLGIVHSEINFLSGDTLTKNLCVYTSHPNFQTDLNVENDEFCSSVLLGYASVEEHQENEFVIYPNPTSNFLFLDINSAESYRYEIVDIQGNQIKNGKLLSQKIAVDNFSEGVYFIRLINEKSGFSVNRKFIKL